MTVFVNNKSGIPLQIHVEFGGEMFLEGSDLSGETEPGEDVTVTVTRPKRLKKK